MTASQRSSPYRGIRCSCAALALVAALQGPAAFALNPDLALTQYSHRAWVSGQQEEGLPQNSVFSVLQTRDGYLWLATQEGLARFDGTRFTVFNARNTPQIRHNDVWKLIEGRDGALWAATRGGGLVRYKDGVFSNVSKEQGLTDDSIQSLWEDRDGGLWIGTRGAGLNYLRDGKVSAYAAKDGLPTSALFALAGASDGSLWIGTDGGGLSRFKDGKFTVMTTADGLPSNTIYALLEDRLGALWIGTGAGLVRMKDGKLSVFRTRDGLSNDNIRALHEDRAGNLWIGTDGGGINRYSRGRFSALTSKQGLSNDSIGAIYEDREGSLWIGTDAGGLNRLKDSKFVSYTTLEGLSDDNARSVLEDRDGALWVGTFGGLNRYKDGKFTAYTKKDGLSSDVVLSLLQDQAGDLWAGTLGGGLNRLSKGKISVYSQASSGLGNDTVLALYEDWQGTLWAGTRSGGLSRFEDGRFRSYTTEQGLSSNDVRVIRGSRDGALWIGTLGGGLNRYKDGQFTSLGKREGLSNDRVLALHEDTQGTLWIGTFGGGLNRYRNGRFTAYTTANGFYDDAIFQILEDADGRLWMSSNRGVFSVDKAQLEAFAEGRISAVTPTIYGKADGMKSNECNGAHQPAGWKSRDGRLWFPTIRGVAVIDPAHIPTNPLPPPVVIEQFLANDQTVVVDASPEVPPGRQKLEFRYTALSYLAPEQVQFKVQLEGFDPDWVSAGSKRIAYYTNIPPGKYRFRVAASNNDGVWNEEGAALGFELQPYFYQAKAFYLVYLFAAGGLAVFAMWFHRLRLEQFQARERNLLRLINEREQAEHGLQLANRSLERRATELARSNAELERFAYVASHDLKEPLRTLTSYTQLLVKKYENALDERAREYIAYTAEAAHSMRSRIESLLEYSRSGHVDDAPAMTDSQVGLSKAMQNLAAAISESGATITSDALPTVRAYPEEIVQLFQNLLDNAIKFRGSQPPRVHISARRRSGKRSEWEISVSDNGIGIDPRSADKVFGLFQRLRPEGKYQGQGIGLAICKKIVEACGGRIWVEPIEGGGSRFAFTLPASGTSE